MLAVYLLSSSCSQTAAKDLQRHRLVDTVRNYFRASEADAPRIFSPIIVLEGLGRLFHRRLLASEKDLESYERFGVEDHVHDVIAELCEIPNARSEFSLGDGIQFENHANTLDKLDSDISGATHGTLRQPSPDQFCVRRLDDSTNTLITTGEFKPPHKLPVEYIRVGLRPMEFWEEVVQRETVPTDPAQKLKYNAEQLTGADLAQEYHVMIHEGLEYSYIINGFALILLHVRHDDPATLYFYLCEPNMEVNTGDEQALQEPKTAIVRVFAQRCNSAAARVGNRFRLELKSRRRSLRKPLPGSEYFPSSPLTSPATGDRRARTRSQAGCAPEATAYDSEPTDSSDTDLNQAPPRRKRNLRQITSSPSIQQPPRSRRTHRKQQNHHAEQFCTQKCLLSLKHSRMLDGQCPNVELHRRGREGKHHLITADCLVQLLKEQLDENLDHKCTPFGDCGAFGAPFKITCATYGYTVVGKGTTSLLWNEVSREADVYRILQKAQGSAVPVFLGAVDLRMVYFLHRGGQIRHMLLMAWGGKDTTKHEHSEALTRKIRRSNRDIRASGVIHKDFRHGNVLWNDELQRALIIDFHRSELERRPIEKRVELRKRSPYKVDLLALWIEEVSNF
ncbi:hypothetical protein CPC735_060190 [Coccidioides posadasii C735 delta SOWgp]|uniref:Protein kinase domain-containing protein n=1 Tax=Coccidioides posadasii (strain C735) TaxID=222929 RepID=C5PF69_COCP7|nr:hypothetical protein CPC735_060190 [Coccidioides posadasii C735 delta SOWgp]EER24649.1 hypothetical protein CPC735_060190 [Coccidioides posadasii C735 delta SOWgp]|eukprot:XP_003066794.1 hypothetical protein CPC735_060190 [Coccidioides posadasii C735 delta SOWgp]